MTESEKPQGIRNTEQLPVVEVPAVQVVLKREGEKGTEVFLGHRIAGGFLNQWSFPGGRIDKGENASQAAKRELFEETGVDIPEERLPQKLRETESMKVFVIDAQNLEPQNASPDEHSEMKWIPVSEALAMHERAVSDERKSGVSRPPDKIPGALSPRTHETIRSLSDSCFPVDAEVAQSVVDDIGEADQATRNIFIGDVWDEIRVESPMFRIVLDHIVSQQMNSEKERLMVQEALFATTLTYSILKKQAKERNIRFPTVSLQILESSARDLDEMIVTKEDIFHYRDRLTEEDRGLMDVINAYAPDPERNDMQMIFLSSVLDTYHWMKRAEISDKMMREIGLADK